MREAIAKALYEGWCEGVVTQRPCFKPHPWWEFKEEEAKSGSIPTTEQFYERADLLLGGFGSVDIVFDPDGEESRFVEIESPPGTSINLGKWISREDGYRVLRIPIAAGHEIQNAPDDAIGCLVCWECRAVVFTGLDKSLWFPDGCPTCGKFGMVIPVLKIPVPDRDQIKRVRNLAYQNEGALSPEEALCEIVILCDAILS